MRNYEGTIQKNIFKPSQQQQQLPSLPQLQQQQDSLSFRPSIGHAGVAHGCDDPHESGHGQLIRSEHKFLYNEVPKRLTMGVNGA